MKPKGFYKAKDNFIWTMRHATNRMEKKNTNSTLDRVPIAKLLKEDKKLYIKKTNSPKKEWGIYLPRKFSIAETQMAER